MHRLGLRRIPEARFFRAPGEGCRLEPSERAKSRLGGQRVGRPSDLAGLRVRITRTAPTENRTEQVCLWDQESVFMKKPPGVADSEMWVPVLILLSASMNLVVQGCLGGF